MTTRHAKPCTFVGPATCGSSNRVVKAEERPRRATARSRATPILAPTRKEGSWRRRSMRRLGRSADPPVRICKCLIARLVSRLRAARIAADAKTFTCARGRAGASGAAAKAASSSRAAHANAGRPDVSATKPSKTEPTRGRWSNSPKESARPSSISAETAFGEDACWLPRGFASLCANCRRGRP